MRSTVIRGGVLSALLVAAAVGGVPGSAVASTATAGARAAASALAQSAPAVAKAACKSCGHNLIANPSAEAGKAGDGHKVAVPGWTQHGQFTVTSYASPGGDVDASSPGSKHRGANYFYGGSSNAKSSGTQTIKVAKSGVKTGKVKYTLSGWLGGYSSQADKVKLTASFRNAKGKQLAAATIGPVTAAQRHDVSGMLHRSAKGKVPAKTRQVVITLTMMRAEGDWNDAMADDLSLVLKAG